MADLTEDEVLHRHDADHIETLVGAFFEAPTRPVTNHEEWLLRVAATLMEREAQISVREHSLAERRRPAKKKA
jgi:hypothetical protein